MSRFVAWLAHVSVSCAFAAVAGIGVVRRTFGRGIGESTELKTHLNGVHPKDYAPGDHGGEIGWYFHLKYQRRFNAVKRACQA